MLILVSTLRGVKMEELILLSKNNPNIKYVRRLSQRRFREKEGKFIIEGVRFLEEAVKADWELELVLFTTRLADSPRGNCLLDLLKSRGTPLMAVEDMLFADLADTDSPQGVLAVAQIPPRPDFDPQMWAKEGKDLILLVDGVRDPGNLGTIIRCADAAGVDGIITFKGVVDPYNAKTLRSTMGSVFRVPIIPVLDQDRFLKDLCAGGWSLVVGDPGADKLIHKCDLTGQVAMVVGSEADGISDAVRQAVHQMVSIPMPGGAESLNAGVAVGIMLYEVVRQRIAVGNEGSSPIF